MKTSRLTDEFGTVHVKRVLATETGTEAVVRNAPMASRGLGSVGPLLFLSPLRLFWFSLLLVLSVLRLLCRLGLLLVLSALRLLCRLGLLLFLSALRLLCRLGLLLVLSVLRLLCRLSLLLVLSVLRLLCWLSLLLPPLLWLLLLLVLSLGVGGSTRWKQEQNCGT
ncbi:MAG: hypothetical protein ABSB35_08535 [Bryobacteraceae bacterium]